VRKPKIVNMVGWIYQLMVIKNIDMRIAKTALE
jgi:hypothetical protein